MANNFDAMRMAVQAVFPTNDVLMDDKDEPSIMVYIPAFRLCDVLSTSDTSVHPAFRMNGKEIAGLPDEALQWPRLQPARAGPRQQPELRPVPPAGRRKGRGLA